MCKFLPINVFLFCCLCLQIATGFAQSSVEDSLETILKTANDSTKIVLLNRFAEKYANSSPDLAFKYANGALHLAEKRSDKAGIIKSLMLIGDINNAHDEYDRALEYYNKAYTLCIASSVKNMMMEVMNSIALVKIYKEEYNDAIQILQEALSLEESTKDTAQAIISFNSLAGCYYYTENYESALQNYIKAAKLSAQLGNKASEAQALLNIGNIYLVQESYKEAKRYYLDALKINEQLNDREGIASCQNNIGAIYERLLEYKNALEYYQKSLKTKETLGNKSSIATSFTNVGNIYSRLKNYSKALEYYRRAIKIYEELSNQMGIAKMRLNIGIVYSKTGEYENAVNYVNRALNMARKINNKEILKSCYEELASVYYSMNDYKNAHDYMEKLSLLKDTIYDESKAGVLAEIQTKYETENKEKAIDLLKKDKELQTLELAKQKILRNSFIGGLTVALLLAFLLYNRNTVKQKANHKLNLKNSELQDKNQIIEKQKEKIIDSITYAQIIQQSILVEEHEIKKHLFDSFVYYQPKDIVSGDFYWFSHLNDKIIIAAIDCTGHGIPGAFMSMIGNSLLNQIVNEKNIFIPSEILKELHKGVYNSLHQEKQLNQSQDGMDIALCMIDTTNNTMQFAGALNPLYIIKDGALEIIKADIYSIGGQLPKKELALNREFTNHIIHIEKGLTFYVFTDGYLDQFGGPDRKKFGSLRFKELLLANQHLDLPAQKDIISTTLNDWKGKTPQIDDILVMGVRL